MIKQNRVVQKSWKNEGCNRNKHLETHHGEKNLWNHTWLSGRLPSSSAIDSPGGGFTRLWPSSKPLFSIWPWSSSLASFKWRFSSRSDLSSTSSSFSLGLAITTPSAGATPPLASLASISASSVWLRIRARNSSTWTRISSTNWHL